MSFLRNGGVIGKQQYPSNIGLEYRANYVYESTAVSSVTFSNADLGTPSPNRCIIVAIGARNSSVTISSCTIGGVTAYIVRSWVDGSATAAFAIARVPTGTTGDIVVNTARHQYSAGAGVGTTATCYIGVWAVKNLPHIFPMDVGVESDGGTENITLRTSRNGFCIMIVANAAGGNGPDTTTSFSANLTKRFDGETSPIQNVGLLAAADGLTDGTNMTFSVTPGDTNVNSPVIAATWDCGDTGGIWHVNSLENTFI